LVRTIAVVTFSRTKMDLTNAVVFYIRATFLYHDVSKVIDNVGELKTAGGAVTSTDDRHLAKP
jgi:uncharacterized membrane protein